MSLKQQRKKATSGPRANCPSCGANVAVFELTSGSHAASCSGVRQAIKDAEDAGVQKRLRGEHDQRKLVMKKQTWSERHFELLGESNFIRQYWAPSMLALALLSWLVGYTTPQGSGSTYFWTFLAGPVLVIVMIVLGFKGRWDWVYKIHFRKKP